MNCLAAAVLLHLAGKPIDEKSVTEVVQSSGAKADAAKVKKVCDALKGKDVMKFARESLSKLGSSSAPATTTAEPVVAAKVDAKKDDKKGGKPAEKKKVEVVEDEEEGGFGGLF